MISKISYHLKSAFRNMIRNLPMTLMAATAVTITLSLIGAFSIIAVNVSQITAGISSNVRIQATVDSQIEKEKITSIEQQIKAIEGVASVQHFTKDQELEKFIQGSNDGEATYGQYRGEQNPLRDAFYIEVTQKNSSNSELQKQQLQSVQAKVKAIDGIVDAQYGGAAIERLVVLLSRIRLIGFILTGALALLATLLIQNTIRSTIHARQVEISIMRNVGASDWFIKVPFMIEGVVIGLLGSVIPIILIYLGYDPIFALVSSMKVFTLVPTYPFIFIIFGILLGIGAIVGLIGSFLSVNKYLRFKR